MDIRNKINYRLVLIADRVKKFGTVNINNHRLELIEEDYFQEIYNALHSICADIVVYNSPESFIDNIRLHRKDLIFSIWSGYDSRNRRALMSSICEAYNIRYIGADTYTNILCQDKTLSKIYAKRFGFDSAKYFLYEGGEWNKADLFKLNLPIIVKPNLEGGSIGISKNNLLKSYEKAILLSQELNKLYKQPILIEEFISGREVSIVILGNRYGIKTCEVIEICFVGNNFSIENSIYSYEIKKENSPIDIYYKIITDEISSIVLENAKKLFVSLDKIEMLRIDGRLNGANFYLLELSPDIHFGAECIFASAFINKNIRYNDMIYQIIENSIQ